MCYDQNVIAMIHNFMKYIILLCTIIDIFKKIERVIYRMFIVYSDSMLNKRLFNLLIKKKEKKKILINTGIKSVSLNIL